MVLLYNAFMPPRFLSVIVPAYNEEANLKNGRLEAVYEFLKGLNDRFELILVDDGSTDKTADLLAAFAQDKKQVRIVKNPHQGKALTVKAGMLAAQGELRLFTDLDQSTPIQEIAKLMPHIERGCEVVIGSREVSGSKREAEPWHRHLMGKVFNLVVRVLAVRGIMDTQCGFKLFTQKATVKLFSQLKVTTQPKPDAFTGAFDVELLFLAQKNHYRIAEVPVIWHHIRSERVNPLKDSVRMFVEVVKIRWTSLTGQYAQPE